MKKCSSCLQDKKDSEFQVRKASKDGLTASCKECLVLRDRARYPKEREKRAETCKLYAATEHGIAVCNKAKIKYTESNLIKRAASHLVGNAVRDKKITKSYVCSECGITDVKIHGHHDDYAFPLIVRWLCSKCHCAWHKKNGSAING